MHHDRMVDILHLGECVDQRCHVIALLDIPVVKAERVEDIGLRSAARFAQTGQRAIHAAEILGDRHFIVVEHDDEVASLLGSVVQAFERHTGTERAVADHGDDVVGLAAGVTRLRQAAGKGDGGAGVAEHELVMLAFLRIRETGGFTGAGRIEIGLCAAGQHLMHVALMRHIEHDAVVGGVEDAVQGDGGLHQAEIGTDMAAMPVPVVEQRRTDLGAQVGKLVGSQGLDIIGSRDTSQQPVVHMSTPSHDASVFLTPNGTSYSRMPRSARLFRKCSQLPPHTGVCSQ